QAKVRRCLVAPLPAMHALHALQCNAEGFRWVKRCNDATPPPARPTRPHEARKPPSILRKQRRFSGMSSPDNADETLAQRPGYHYTPGRSVALEKGREEDSPLK